MQPTTPVSLKATPDSVIMLLLIWEEYGVIMLLRICEQYVASLQLPIPYILCSSN